MLAGWDGEEYGMLGSTEWVEQFRRGLRRNAVAYANSRGPEARGFYASGVPQLDDAVIEATKAVTDPRTGGSVYAVWKGCEMTDPQPGRLGSGSDYTAFLEHAGVPSVEASFGGAGRSPAPTTPPTTTARTWSGTSIPAISAMLGSARVAGVTGAAPRERGGAAVPVLRLRGRGRVVRARAQKVQAATPGAAQVDLSVLRRAARVVAAGGHGSRGPGGRGCSARATARRDLARLNHALMRQERALTTRRGLPGRPWYRHQIYAPGVATGYAVQYLPGLRDAVEHGDDETARSRRDVLLGALRRATRLAAQGAAGRS